MSAVLHVLNYEGSIFHCIHQLADANILTTVSKSFPALLSLTWEKEKAENKCKEEHPKQARKYLSELLSF
jgi:hypothetical protein